MISSIGKPLNSFFSWYLERRMFEIENFKLNPEIVQQQTLSNLISSAKSTQFGISNNFSSVYNTSSFKSIIPLKSSPAPIGRAIGNGLAPSLFFMVSMAL